MIMEFSIAGVDELMAKLESLAGQSPIVVARSMNDSAEKTMARSKAEYCPVDTGALRSSGMVQTSINGPVVETKLGYGGAAQNYAVYVHEINKNYRGGRSWKYLEIPLKEDLSSYSEAMIAAINAMNGGQ